MVFTTWMGILNESFQSLLSGLVLFIPNLVIAAVLFIIGWLIGIGLERVVKQVVDALRLDAVLKAAGVERVIERAGYDLSLGTALGVLVKWFVIVVFLVASLDILHLGSVNAFLIEVVLGYLPQVIGAVLILLVAAIVADTVQRMVSGAARAADLQSANLMGSVARYSIWIFAILAALAQLQVATAFVQTLFTGVVIAVSLAIGLAFGLGGQVAAARYLEHLRGSIKD